MSSSLLVTGGGAVGIQVSLDLGNMGLEVFLVESSPNAQRWRQNAPAQ